MILHIDKAIFPGQQIWPRVYKECPPALPRGGRVPVESSPEPIFSGDKVAIRIGNCFLTLQNRELIDYKVYDILLKDGLYFQPYIYLPDGFPRLDS